MENCIKSVLIGENDIWGNYTYGTYSLHSGLWIDHHPDRHMSYSSISLQQLLNCQDMHSEKGGHLGQESRNVNNISVSCMRRFPQNLL